MPGGVRSAIRWAGVVVAVLVVVAVTLVGASFVAVMLGNPERCERAQDDLETRLAAQGADSASVQLLESDWRLRSFGLECSFEWDGGATTLTAHP